MLFILIPLIWLGALVLAVTLCQAAAHADERTDTELGAWRVPPVERSRTGALRRPTGSPIGTGPDRHRMPPRRARMPESAGFAAGKPRKWSVR